jgi:hypothetical protein
MVLLRRTGKAERTGRLLAQTRLHRERGSKVHGAAGRVAEDRMRSGH